MADLNLVFSSLLFAELSALASFDPVNKSLSSHQIDSNVFASKKAPLPDPMLVMLAKLVELAAPCSDHLSSWEPALQPKSLVPRSLCYSWVEVGTSLLSTPPREGFASVLTVDLFLGDSCDARRRSDSAVVGPHTRRLAALHFSHSCHKPPRARLTQEIRSSPLKEEREG